MDIRLFRKAQYEMAARAERKRSVRVTEVPGSRQGREELELADPIFRNDQTE
jgi:hypothetical protein